VYHTRGKIHAYRSLATEPKGKITIGILKHRQKRTGPEEILEKQVIEI
jgi:hypothetical protein